MICWPDLSPGHPVPLRDKPCPHSPFPVCWDKCFSHLFHTVFLFLSPSWIANFCSLSLSLSLLSLCLSLFSSLFFFPLSFSHHNPLNKLYTQTLSVWCICLFLNHDGLPPAKMTHQGLSWLTKFRWPIAAPHGTGLPLVGPAFPPIPVSLKKNKIGIWLSQVLSMVPPAHGQAGWGHVGTLDSDLFLMLQMVKFPISCSPVSTNKKDCRCPASSISSLFAFPFTGQPLPHSPVNAFSLAPISCILSLSLLPLVPQIGKFSWNSEAGFSISSHYSLPRLVALQHSILA